MTDNPTNEERAREIADLWDTFDDDGLTNAISAALERVRRVERERCAKLAERHRCAEFLVRHKMSHVDQVGVVSTAIANAIRSDGGNGDG